MTSLRTVALSATASLISLQAMPPTQAMTVAWDCFDRSTQTLVARSAVDLTSPAISCLEAVAPNQQPTAADTALQHSVHVATTPELEQASLEIHPPAELQSMLDPAGAPQPQASPGEDLGSTLGSHFGRLLGQGLADLFGRKR
jgi:hypothetical protein